MSHNALHSLVQAGLSARMIKDLGAEAVRRRLQLSARGFPENFLEGQNLFNIDPQSLPLLTGQGEVDREARGLEVLEGSLFNRRNLIPQALNFRLQLAESIRRAEQDPFRLGEHLLNLSRLGRKTSTPLQGLLGEGVFIDPRLPDPLRDIEGQLGKLEDFAGDTPNFRGGGRLRLTEPVAGVGLESGRVRFLAGEAGDEDLEFTPQSRATRFGHGGTAQVRPTGRLTKEKGILALAKAFGESGLPSTRAGQETFKRRLNRATSLQREGFTPTRSGSNRFGSFTTLEGPEQRRKVTVGSNVARTAEDPRLRRLFYDEAGNPILSARKRSRLLTESLRGGGSRSGLDRATSGGGGGGTGIGTREASAIAVGKALQSNPFADQGLIDRLLAGLPPLASQLTQELLANSDPGTIDLLLSVGQQFGARPEQQEFEARRFFVPGFRVSGVSR